MHADQAKDNSNDPADKVRKQGDKSSGTAQRPAQGTEKQLEGTEKEKAKEKIDVLNP
jgi:hypothetical protein